MAFVSSTAGFAAVLAGAFRVRLALGSVAVFSSPAFLRAGAFLRVVDRVLGFSASTDSATSATSSIGLSFRRLGARRRRPPFSVGPSVFVSANFASSEGDSSDFDGSALPFAGARRRRLGLPSFLVFVSDSDSPSAVTVSSVFASEFSPASFLRSLPRPPRRPRRDRRRPDFRFSSSNSSSDVVSSFESASDSDFPRLDFLGFRFAASRSFLKSRSICTSGSGRLSSRFSTTSNSKCGRMRSSSPTTSVKTSAILSTCVSRSRFSLSR